MLVARPHRLRLPAFSVAVPLTHPSRPTVPARIRELYPGRGHDVTLVPPDPGRGGDGCVPRDMVDNLLHPPVAGAADFDTVVLIGHHDLQMGGGQHVFAWTAPGTRALVAFDDNAWWTCSKPRS